MSHCLREASDHSPDESFRRIVWGDGSRQKEDLVALAFAEEPE